MKILFSEFDLFDAYLIHTLISDANANNTA